MKFRELLANEAFLPEDYEPNFIYSADNRVMRCKTCGKFLSAKRLHQYSNIIVTKIDEDCIATGVIHCYICNTPLWQKKAPVV